MIGYAVKTIVLAAAAFLTVFAAAHSTRAAEAQQFLSAYTPEELAGVRAWEKSWAGKKIDKTNIDGVAEFFPESWVTIFKNPRKWGTPEGKQLYLYIEPYEKIKETAGMIAATRKYAPMVKTDESGHIINTAELAGFPFPDPKTGLEVAYNMEFQNRGDTYAMNWYAPVIDPRAHTDRLADQDWKEMYFIHRTELDPLPAYDKKHNPKGYHKGQLLDFNKPPEMSGSRMIAMKFIDESKEYESYLYYAQFRRIKRLSQAERTNAIDGTDMIYDDGNMWDSYLSRSSFTLTGRKDMLLARDQDMDSTSRVAGQAVASGYSFQRCKTYVVEVRSDDPDYLYSKRIWYVDPETYWIHWQECYDQLGRFWKLYMQPTQNIKTDTGETKNFMIGFSYNDVQRRHSGHTDITVKGISINIGPRIFLLSNLQRSY